jgi:hypothetical protein
MNGRDASGAKVLSIRLCCRGPDALRLRVKRPQRPSIGVGALNFYRVPSIIMALICLTESIAA